ncbi:VanZ family protein [Salinimicrobium catena]|uniref:VanZ family protein n=1 Tax=Salinimicrobium catena TaxID=390640 RepID=UPI002FE4805B
MKARYLFLIPAIVYTIGILYLSLINLADTPVKELGMSDKVMHGGAYFGLNLLWMFFVIFNYKNNRFLAKILVISLAAIVFGILIEVLQDRLTTYRQLDLYDVLANSIGVVSAGIIVWLLKDSLIRLKAKINLFFIKK